MFIAALFIVAKKRKQSKCLLIDKQMNKNPYHEMLFCHRMVVLIYAAIQLNLENILSGKSQSQQTIYCMIPFIRNEQNRQI